MKKIYTIFALSAASIAFAQIQKVEPAFWWKGMKNPELQILVYGKDIAKNEIELSDGVQIKDIQKVENPNYVFVTVNTNEINVPKFKINIKNGKKNISSYTYELKQRNPDSSNRESYSSKDVMYLIMPDRFANGDEKNDSSPNLTEKANRNLPNGRHGGDLRGIINNLDYIQNLGATAVWLTPVNEDNEKYILTTDMHRPIYTRSMNVTEPTKSIKNFPKTESEKNETRDGLCNQSLGSFALDDQRSAYKRLDSLVQ